MPVVKTLKLALVALAAIIATIAIIGVTDPLKLRQSFLCFRKAVSLTSCYRGGHFDFVADLGGVKYEGNTGDYLDNKIYHYGAFEKPILYLIKDLMQIVYGANGIFIDVGANTGQHSLFMSRHAKFVHAFEPWEPVLKRFRHMVMLNHIENIAIHPIGLGDENTQKPFFRPPDGESLTGSFEKNFRSDNAYAGELEIQTGDDAFAKAQIKSPSIIKIDIESYEKLALRGLRETLARNRPIVVFEMTIDPNSPVTIKSKDELSTLFPDRYEFARISETGDPSSGVYILGSIDGITFDRYQQHDLLAFPSERKNSIPRHGPNH